MEKSRENNLGAGAEGSALEAIFAAMGPAGSRSASDAAVGDAVLKLLAGHAADGAADDVAAVGASLAAFFGYAADSPEGRALGQMARDISAAIAEDPEGRQRLTAVLAAAQGYEGGAA